MEDLAQFFQNLSRRQIAIFVPNYQCIDEERVVMLRHMISLLLLHTLHRLDYNRLQHVHFLNSLEGCLPFEGLEHRAFGPI